MNKTLTLLGFASKARKLSYGLNASKESAKNGKSKLLIVCSDISEKSKKEIVFFSEKYKIPFKVLKETMQELSVAVGKECGIVSVNDAEFCKSIKAQEEQE